MEFQKVTIKKSPWVQVTDEEIKKMPKPKKSPHLDVYCRVTLKDGRTGNIVDIDMENGVSLYSVELDDEVKPLGVETPSILLPPSARAVGL